MALRVLVVEDMWEQTETLALLLRLYRCEVRTALEAATAISLAPAFRPHVGLLNIGLPGMDGHGLARWFRARPDLGHTALIATSGCGGDEYQRACRESGFDFALSKPLDLEALVEILLLAGTVVHYPGETGETLVVPSVVADEAVG